MDRQQLRAHLSSSLLLSGVAAAAYLLCAELGQALTMGGHEIATFWPAGGVQVALLLSTHPRHWPAIALAGLLANYFSNDVLHGMPAPLAEGFAVANGLEAVTAAFIVRHLVGERIRFSSVSESSAFVLGAVVVAPALGATVGAAVLASSGVDFTETWPDWWATDALSQLMIPPLLLSLGDWRERLLESPRRRWEAAWVLAFLLLALTVFHRSPMGVPTPYVVIPVAIWATMRFGLGGGMCIVLLASTWILWANSRGIGPYASLLPDHAPFLIQTTMATFAITVLALSTLFREREGAVRETLRAKEQLEERVRQRTRELEASEEVYRRLFELSPDGIFVHREGRIRYANAAMLRLLGADRPEQVLGHDPLEFIAPEHHALVQERILHSLAVGGSRPQIEQRWKRIDGRELFVEVSAARHDAVQGKGVQVLVRDVSERRRVQLELEERETRLRLAVQAARMFAFEWDPRRGTVRRSDECEEILGLPGGVDDPDERYMAGVLDEDRPKFQAVLDGLSPQADHYTTLYRFRRSDGVVLQLEETARATFDAQGRLERLVGMTVDVSAREQALARLRASEARFAGVASAVAATLFTTLPSGECDYVNESFLEFSGMSREQAMGHGWMSILHPQDRERTLVEWRAALQGQGPFVTEYRLRRHDGEYRWFKADCRPVLDERGVVRQWVGVALDVEDQKRTQELLRQADRRKDEFLAMLAHELRTPLAPIHAAVDILALHAGRDPQLGRAAEVLARQVAHLARLVDDLLDVSRVTHGKIKLAFTSLELATAVQAAVDLARPALLEKRQHLDLVLPSRRAYVRADPTRFAQILGNLLGNAIKYSPRESTVHVTVEVVGDQALLRVADKGMGIPADLLPFVFEPFVQGERALDRSQGGLGLGLALVRALVELHGGCVRAESAGAGQGAAFEVRLPLTDVPPARKPAGPLREGASKRVLLVEDNYDAAEMLGMLLRLQGYTLEVAHDGATGVELARRFRPQVALLDLGLPILDGYQLAQRLRSDPATSACRLIALSGYGQPEDRARSKASGFDLHLVKPVDPEVLYEAIEAHAAPTP